MKIPRIVLGYLGVMILGGISTHLNKLRLYEKVSPAEPNRSLVTSSQTRLRESRPEQKNLLRLKADYGSLPLSFEPNEGQTDPQVKFLARGNGYSLYLTSREAILSLHTGVPANYGEPRSRSRARTKRACPAKNESRGRTSYAKANETSLHMRLVGAANSPRSQGIEELPGKVNYFLGSDPAAWRTNIPTYTRIKYDSVYPGVDLIYYGNQQQLENDFVVAPFADPGLIMFELQGADSLDLDRDGNIIVHGAGEEIRLRKPTIYQGEGALRRVVGGRYMRRGSRRFGFEVAEYDRSRPLIIDPVLSYSTLLGGSDIGHGDGIAVDAAGNAYVVGVTGSVDFPTISPFQLALRGRSDAFITKLNPAGTGLVYSTYVGGLDYDEATGIAVDSAGNAYVSGRTSSSDFPTKNPIQAAFGGNEDGFVLKLNSTGDTLVYSTYLGGSSQDFATGIALDMTGSAYVVGATNSLDFPTKNSMQAYMGAQDVFLAKVNPAGDSFVYSTFVGGSGQDWSGGIAVDLAGNAFITGQTFSFDFPTKNPFQATNHGNSDGFVAKVNSTGSALVYSTYLGGNQIDAGVGIAIDSAGNTYVTGWTASPDFPTQGGMQSLFSDDAFVTELDPTGTTLLYSTLLGGSDDDAGTAIAVDSSGNAYLTGTTESSDFPTRSALQKTFTPGNCCFSDLPCPCDDVFVAKLDTKQSGPSSLPFSTYLGNSGEDYGAGIALDATGNVYITGGADPGFPVTPGAFDTKDGTTAFVLKIGPEDSPRLAVSSGSLDFGLQPIGVISAPRNVTLSNVGTASLTISSLSVTGANSGDFSLSDSCDAVLTGGTQCTVGVTFSPGSSGPRIAAISIVDDAPGSPQSISLSGQGANGASASLSPTDLEFGNQPVETASAPKSLMLTNTGTGALTVDDVQIAGPDLNDFTASSECGASLAAGASCSINIAFSPLSVGARLAYVKVFDNSTNSPLAAELHGTGFVGAANFSVTSSATVQTVVAGQTATYTLTLSSSSGFNGAVSLGCSDPIGASSCAISPSLVTVSGNTPATATVTVTTTFRSSVPRTLWRPKPPSPPQIPLVVVLTWLAVIFAMAAHRKPFGQRFRPITLAGFCTAAILLTLCCGCGGSGTANPMPDAGVGSTPHGTPAGIYQVTVTGSSGTISHSTVLSLTVQ
jgi:hypothetical protein